MRAGRISSLAVTAAADAVAALADGGYLRIYDGEQPATVDTAPTGRLLAEMRFGRPAFVQAVDGEAVATPIAEDRAARARGTASWFRAYSEAELPLWDGSVGTGAHDLVVATAAFVEGAIISVSSFALRLRKE